MNYKSDLINKLRRGLIVSCQAKESDPHYTEEYTLQMAKAAVWGGAVGLRLDTPKDIYKIRQVVDIPIIGLWKIFNEDTEVFITPKMEHVRACIEAGADIIAVDSTNRLVELCGEEVKVIMESKVNTLEEAVIALYHGAHAVVVGNAITRPHITTQRFTDAINGYEEKRSLFYWKN